MKFKFTNHAQSQIFFRGLSLLDLKDVIMRPSFSIRKQNDIIVSIKNVLEKGKIGVVYRKLPKYYLIITVYYADKK